MTIADEAAKQAAIRQFLERRRELQQAVATAYHQIGGMLVQMVELQDNVAAWQAAAPGTTEAELHALYRAVIPVENDGDIHAIAVKVTELRAAIEAADIASGGTWFSVTGGA